MNATGCEKNQIIFELIHSKRNRLKKLWLNALVHVKYNMRQQLRQKRRDEKGDNYYPISLSDLDFNDE